MFVSLEDELVRLYAPKLALTLKGLQSGAGGAEELTGMAQKRAAWVFHIAQRRAEKRARISRADVLRQDDWIEQNLPGQ
jgi:preprotein translocase subunit SecA